MKSSPLNELTAQDIVRKKIKMQKIKDQMNPEHEAYRPGAQKKLAEKHHKTKYQIDTGKRGRPTSLRNEEWLAGPSRNSSSPVNNLTEGDEIVSSAEGSANYRKSALNMLGVSPLNNDSIRNDSINRDIAIKKFKGDYEKVGKVKSGEYDREKGEFHWDGNKISLIPTDDAEVQNTTGIQPKNQGKNWK